MKRIHLALVTAGLLTLSSAGFCEGTRGGGDAESARIREIVRIFDGKHEDLTEMLVRIAGNVAKTAPMGEVSAQIDLLVQKGLIQDFKNATYDLEQKCVDETGTEKSASTTKVDLSENPNQPSPSICINVRKLAEEAASYQDIVGLLFHEHSRHFGMEDSSNLDLHPIADFVTEKYDALGNSGLAEASSAGGLAVIPGGNNVDSLHLGRRWQSAIDFFIDPVVATRILVPDSVTVSEKSPLKIVVDSLDGQCKRAYCNDFSGNKYDSLKVGSTIEITKSHATLVFVLEENPLERIIDWTPFSAFNRDHKCTIGYHAEFAGAKSDAIQTKVHSNTWMRGGLDDELRIWKNAIVKVGPADYLDDLK